MHQEGPKGSREYFGAGSYLPDWRTLSVMGRGSRPGGPNWEGARLEPGSPRVSIVLCRLLFLLPPRGAGNRKEFCHEELGGDLSRSPCCRCRREPPSFWLGRRCRPWSSPEKEGARYEENRSGRYGIARGRAHPGG